MQTWNLKKKISFLLPPPTNQQMVPWFRQPPCVLLPLALPLWFEPGWLPSVVPRRHPRWRGGRGCLVLPEGGSRRGRKSGSEQKPYKNREVYTKIYKNWKLLDENLPWKNDLNLFSPKKRICFLKTLWLIPDFPYFCWEWYVGGSRLSSRHCTSPEKMTWLLYSPTKWFVYSSKHHVSSKTFVRLAESHQWSMLHKSPNS